MSLSSSLSFDDDELSNQKLKNIKSELTTRSLDAQKSLLLPFKLIITDCNMPVMDGLEMGLEIKKSY